MRQSQLFTKTRKEAPSDEVSKNAILLTRAGYIHKELAGAYAYLPLGLRVLKKIEGIIREEMNSIGGQEMTLTALQDKKVWEATGRWDDAVVDNWFKTKLKNDTELGLAYTHEAALAELMKDYLNSYRDLPTYPYQFQTKFRNELRAKSGLFRGREFLMKDLYSFSATQEDLDEFYKKAIQAYKNIFSRVGLGDKTYLTVASGGTFGVKYSHEFQTLTEAGEDTIFIHKDKGIAINKEVLSTETLSELGVKSEDLAEEKAVEVGNIYKLGTFYSEPLALNFKDVSGEKKPVIMGSYGIGLGRLMGTVVEVLSDERGIVWPKSIAPFQVHLLSLTDGSQVLADDLYSKLVSEGVEVLYDDRDIRAGEKFADADLIGIPFQVIVGEKSLEADALEVKDRKSGAVRQMSLRDIVEETQ